MQEKTLIIQDPVLKRNFTTVPNVVLTAPGLSLAAKALYAILLMFAWQNNECWPGQDKLAEAAGCSDRTVRKYLDELRDYGLISWTQRGLNQTNIYYIHDLAKVGNLKTLEALSDADRKILSGQDRKILSDKEDPVNNIVVVVRSLAEYDNSDGKTGRLKDNSGGDVFPDGLADNAKHEQNAAAGSPITEKVKAEIAAVDDRLLQEPLLNVLSRYGEEEILRALAVVRQQRRVENPAGLFRSALENGWRPSEAKQIKASGRFTPEKKSSEKKKELIRNLYLS